MDQDNSSNWQYKPDNQADGSAPPPGSGGARPPKPRHAAAVSWQASEFIEHSHGFGWYSLLVLITAALTAAVYFVTKDIFATCTIPLVGFIVAVFARQKPRQIGYEIASVGIKVGEKTYAYNLFKSFAIIREGALTSVNLFPLKRFMPPVSAYFDPADEPKITEALGTYLPYEDRQLDGIDRLTRRLRL